MFGRDAIQSELMLFSERRGQVRKTSNQSTWRGGTSWRAIQSNALLRFDLNPGRPHWPENCDGTKSSRQCPQEERGEPVYGHISPLTSWKNKTNHVGRLSRVTTEDLR
ncbi:hypothetical protein SRHO_G00342970 [Serrasalmus rhombeus]